MKTKIYNSLFSKTMIILFCLFIAINPFFQPKRVEANPVVLFGAVGLITMGLIGAGYIRDAAYTPEQQNQINEKATQYLQEAFPDPIDYNKQMNILQNLNEKAINGEDIDWSKYSGKALYAVLKGVVDVVWPYKMTDAQENQLLSGGVYFLGCVGNTAISYTTQNYKGKPIFNFAQNYGSNVLFNMGNVKSAPAKLIFYNLNIQTGRWQNSYGGGDSSRVTWATYETGYLYNVGNYVLNVPKDGPIAKILLGGSNHTNVPNISKKVANKVKLPTRLPQTVINNINNYIDGSTENLIVNPTPEELPTLPDGYNPNTDDLINLPGYEDVTPDQEPSTDPEPTPTPEPTPEPTPDYNGDHWVNPIGDFMDGLLKFMKAAFVPTLSLNLDALNSMPDNLSEKFPFSLPGDLVRLFGVFQAEPVPFAFDWEMDFTSVGAGKIPIKGDLTMFDKYAPLFRNLAFIAFIIGLAWKTFGMFFGGGDE